MSKHLTFDFADYTPVDLRHRHDGWSAARQYDFLLSLSESACVEEACRAVGKSAASAYALRRRSDAGSFREAWDAALDYAVGRLADAAMSRALHGVARPIFYKGELVGERRYFDERLTMFMLRLRDPVTYGRHREHGAFTRDDDALALRADAFLDLAERDAGRRDSKTHFAYLRDQPDDDDDEDGEGWDGEDGDGEDGDGEGSLDPSPPPTDPDQSPPDSEGPAPDSEGPAPDSDQDVS